MLRTGCRGDTSPLVTRSMRGGIMRINENDIMDEVEAHMRKSGGERSEWCVGTAKDCQGPFFLRHQEQDLGDQMIYREAYTSYAAEELEHRDETESAPKSDRLATCRAVQGFIQVRILPGRVWVLIVSLGLRIEFSPSPNL